MTTRKDAPDPNEPASAPDRGFPVVGIGASAGGLAAIEQFLSAMPPADQADIAIVLVQHLDPDHESLLLDLIQRYAKLDASWAEDGVEVRSGHIYIMPKNKDIAFAEGRLVVTDPEQPRGLRLPIDHFFRSLAEDQADRAIGVVLSGTGSDGTQGLRAIKGEGGMTIAQDPASASYDGMPRSAVAAGIVDYVLDPSEMPDALLGYVGRAMARPAQPLSESADGADALPQILAIVRAATGHDFSHYKVTTTRRRVERRMAISKIERAQDYLMLLKNDPLEVDTLFRELLIGVTEFFRDPDAFEVLAREVIPRIVESKSPGDYIRVWMPACSTGEEAYSVMIALHEALADVDMPLTVQGFATDIDARAVEKARAGVYPSSIAANMSPERLERYFVEEQDAYRVSKAIRDMLVFAKQDVTKDPPFSRVDLVCCRNMLIYLDVELQRKLMSVFHYALNPGGFLFLGISETVGEATDLFAPISTKWKLFQRRGVVTPREQLLSTTVLPEGRRAPDTAKRVGQPPLRVRVRELAEQALLDRHVPAAVVINADGEVLFIHGHTGKYLEPAPGEASGDLLKMARGGLKLELASSIRQAQAHQAAVRYDGLRMESDGDVHYVNLVVEPLSTPEQLKGVLLVLFEAADSPRRDQSTDVAAVPLADREQRIADLDRELSAKEEYLRATISGLETANEELKSTNEELQSANEELQSTNEELETSKEELQSVNEELVTVNSELQQKIAELSQANNDMNNLLAGTGIGTVFLDNDLRIQRFTPAATRIIKLIPTDVGRPVDDIVSRLRGDSDITGIARTVLDTLVSQESEVETDDGRTYLMRIQPYRTTENVIEGAVVTFVDTTMQRELRERVAEMARAADDARAYAESIVDTVREPLLVLDDRLTIVSASRSFYSAFGLTPELVVGRPLLEIDDGAWDASGLRDLLVEVLPKRRVVQDHSLELVLGSGRHLLTVNARELIQEGEKRRLILLAITHDEVA